MHTAICAFDERDRAQQAVDSLIRAGFHASDVHIEQKTVSIEGDPLIDRRADDAQQPVRDRGALASFGAFFASLLGGDNPSGHADTYSQHVERGSYVVVVDGKDAAEAQRARTLLQEMQGGDINVVDRAAQRPLRDIVGGRAGTAGMVDRSRDVYESMSGEPLDRERAMASNRLNATTGPALRDPDVTHAPGLRYADKDKPNG
jgi:hypothetical protein